MKNLSIFILLLALNMCANAQDAATPNKSSDNSTMSNGFIGLLGGYSISMGNWTHTTYITGDAGKWLSDNPDNLSAGFAGNGSTYGVEGGWYFCKYLGIGGLVSYSHYGFTGLDSISAGFDKSFDVDQITTTVSGGYDIWNFMGGLYFRYPFSDKFAITAKLLGGFTSATTPQIAVDVEDGGVDDGSFYQQRCTANSFGYMAGLGVSYKLSKCMGLNLQGIYASSEPDFLIDNTNRNNSIGRLITEYKQPLTSINICLGLTYLLGSK
jgi:hypothetical protein